MAGPANYTLYAQIMPALAPGFTNTVQTQINNGLRRVRTNVPPITPQINQRALTQQASGVGKKVSGILSTALGGLAIGAGFSFLKGLVSDAQESAKVMAITQNVIKTTGGAANVTAEQIGNLATAISNKTGADDEAIQSGENLLLTFTNLQNRAGKGNDIFNQTTEIMADMSAAMNNGDVSSSSLKATSIQLGKALNNPIKGITALSKVGVTFTDQQKAQIKAMQESGDIAGAQKIILAELRKEFGGTAEAAATPFKKLETQIGNLREALGAKLLPIFGKVADMIIKNVLPAISNLADNYGPKVSTAFQSIRTSIAGLVDKYGPMAVQIFNFIKDAIIKIAPTVKDLAVNGFTILKTVLAGVIQGIISIVGWITRNQTLVLSLATGIGVLIAAYKAYQLYQFIATGAAKAWFIQTKIISAATKAWSAVQVAFNVIMSANPVALVIVGLVALGAALIVAYKRSETFRNIVNGVFKAVGTAASWLWNNVLKPVWGYIKTGWSILMKAVVSYWNSWLKPAFQAIGVMAKWLWNSVLKPTWAYVKAGWAVLVKGITDYWNNKLKPAFQAIGVMAKWLWNSVLKPTWNSIKTAWSTLWTAAKSAWDNVGKPIFDRVKTVVGQVKTAFEKAVTGIKTAWDKIKEIAAAPVRFIINTVYNNGIRKFWNGIASKVGLGQLDEIKGFATGGKIPGNSGMRFQDDRLASSPHGPIALAGGEYIMNARSTQKYLPQLEAMNSAHNGGGDGGFARGGIPGFGLGGWLGDLAGKAKDGIRGALGGLAGKMLSGLKTVLNSMPGSGTGMGDMLKQIPITAGQKMVDWIKGDDKKNPPATDAGGGPIGAGGFANALSWARTQAGKPYIWASAGPTGYDCSGFMSAILNVIGGRNPYHRLYSTGDAGGQTLAGMTRNKMSPFRVGVVHGNPGHTAGTLNGVNVESTGSGGVKVGGSARGAANSLFSMHYGLARGGMVGDGPFDLLNRKGRKYDPLAAKLLQDGNVYDRGGWLKPGQVGMNRGSRPEAVLTPAESAGLKRGLMSRGGGSTYIGGDTIVSFGDIHSDVDMQMAVNRATRMGGAGF